MAVWESGGYLSKSKLQSGYVRLEVETETTGQWVNWWATLRIRTTGSLADNYSSGHISINGSVSVSYDTSRVTTVSHGAGGGTTAVLTTWGSFERWYGQDRQISFGAVLGNFEIFPGLGSTGGSITVPARPYELPYAPWTADRVLDEHGRPRLSWTPSYTSSTGARPWTGVRIYRSVNGGYWIHVATVNWRQTTWTDLGTSENNQYRYRVDSYNETGQTAGPVTEPIGTRPAAPGKPTITKDGNDLVVTFPDNSRTEDEFQLYHDEGEGGPTHEWITGIPGNGLATGGEISYRIEDANPALAHRVRARAVAPGGLISAESPWSDTVQLQAPPNRPTNISFANAVIDADLLNILTWQHNPVDGSPQTKYEVYWALHDQTSGWHNTQETADQSHPFTSGKFSNGSQYKGTIRTWGIDPDPSAWAEYFTFRACKTPTITLTGPSTVTTAAVTVAGTYTAGVGGAEQLSRTYRILDGAEVVGEWTIQGVGMGWTSPATLENDKTYTLEAWATNLYGQKSNTVTLTLPVEYLPPPATVLTLEWETDEGAVEIALTTPPPTGGQPDVEAVTVQRFEDGRWVTLASDLPADGSITDTIPPLQADVPYRAITAGNNGTQTISPTTTISTRDRTGWVFLNAGPGFTQRIRLRDNAGVEVAAGPSKKLHQFANRTGVVGFRRGRSQGSRSLSFTASAHSAPQTALADVEEFVREVVGAICVRDPSGGLSGGSKAFMEVSGDMTYSYSKAQVTGASIPLVEASYRE